MTAGITLALKPQPAAALADDADNDDVVEERFFAYVTNEGSNDVSMIDTLTNTVVATMGVGINPTGVAITPLVVGVTITTIDVPGAARAAAYGITARGQIVGQYTDAGGVDHGFIAKQK